ncbi:MAG: DUF5683 domain-containing protein [Paludibacteraceae bacterium]|jgi:hypothetical protein|nr:DUF5683 domain-containing protein [Paludibacteraceae bacterium]HOU67340.1 DUF5683 domain-containing protein [Paludibacteraceae bacterium]HQF49836.1 DUF5683 domain-containing protein [Paludibacteraceae bacterium]HQJ90461.1 DUF5683 domain-containing protein [Paludibacteraceae bacterium]
MLKKYSIVVVAFLMTFLGYYPVFGQESKDSTIVVTESGNTFLLTDSTKADSVVVTTVKGPHVFKSSFAPDPTRATWYALVCPGLGQIYNRSYWKVPIVYGGMCTLAYLILWNGRMYNDYKNAYHDIADNDPNTNSYERLISGYTNSDMAWLSSTLMRKRDSYRRYRDLSIFGMAGLYVLSVVDAFVDAHLYDFTVSDDLSLRVEPVINPYLDGSDYKPTSVFGFQCSVSF